MGFQILRFHQPWTIYCVYNKQLIEYVDAEPIYTDGWKTMGLEHPLILVPMAIPGTNPQHIRGTTVPVIGRLNNMLTSLS